MTFTDQGAENSSSSPSDRRCVTCMAAFTVLLNDPIFTLPLNAVKNQYQFSRHNDTYVARREVKIHDDFQALDVSAATGCPICRIYRYEILLGADSRSRDSNGSVRADCLMFLHRERRISASTILHCQRNIDLDSTIYLTVTARDRPEGGAAYLNFLQLPDVLRPLVDDEHESAPCQPTIMPRTTAIATFDGESVILYHMLRSWLDECCNSHHVCNKRVEHGFAGDLSTQTDIKEQAAFLPTRLLQIIDHDGIIHVKLVLSSEVSWNHLEQTHYCTLSYCWGANVAHFTTTRENYPLHRDGVLLDQLPKTFRDAITMTLKLHCTFLWIDALCIIQPTSDDHADWDFESGRMRDVYRMSYATIAAANAEDVHGGLFSLRDPYKYELKPCEIEDLYQESTQHPQQMKPLCLQHTGLMNWRLNVERSPLTRRGWILQERLLSPRTIFVAKHGLFWECNTYHASEHQPAGFNAHENSKRYARDTIMQWPRVVASNYSHQVWADIVSEFSTRKLTEPTDALPALSGITQEFAKSRPDRFLAGLWQSTLKRDLCWRTLISSDDPNPRPPRRKDIPSWTWASVQTEILYLWTEFDRPELSVQHLVEIFDAHTNPAGPDPYGHVKGGTLLIRAQAHIVKSKILALTLSPASSSRLNISEILPEVYMTFDTLSDLDALRNLDPDSDQTLLFLHVQTYHNASKAELQHYIALTKVETNPDDKLAYRRIGFVEELVAFTDEETMMRFPGETVDVMIV